MSCIKFYVAICYYDAVTFVYDGKLGSVTRWCQWGIRGQGRAFGSDILRGVSLGWMVPDAPSVWREFKMPSVPGDGNAL